MDSPRAEAKRALTGDLTCMRDSKGDCLTQGELLKKNRTLLQTHKRSWLCASCCSHGEKSNYILGYDPIIINIHTHRKISKEMMLISGNHSRARDRPISQRPFFFCLLLVWLLPNKITVLFFLESVLSELSERKMSSRDTYVKEIRNVNFDVNLRQYEDAQSRAQSIRHGANVAWQSKSPVRDKRSDLLSLC